MGWASRAWSFVAPRLAARFRLYILDLRGHGSSAKPDCCYALADFAYDVKLFMDRAGLAEADIAGHSLGSLIAQRLAAGYPGRARRLILVGSTVLAPFSQGDEISRGIATLADPLDPDRNEFLAAWLTQTELAVPDPDFPHHARADALAIPAVVWRGIGRELTDRGTEALAPDIRAGILILSSPRDELFDAQHLDALDRAFPEADHRLLDEGGHNLIFEAPVAVANAIGEFLAHPAKP